MTQEGVIDKGQVVKAVHALFQYVEKTSQKDKDFLAEGEEIFVQLVFKKVPENTNQCIKISLPTTLMKESSDVCLFVKDLDKNDREYESTVEHFEDLLASKGITNISEIIPLKKLQLEYSPYEAKRNLSNMYSVYLADERVCGRLPNLLGKNFYGRKRVPIPVDMESPKLKKEVDKALSFTYLTVAGRGGSGQVTVANTFMKEEEVVENIMVACDRVQEKLLDGIDNIRVLHLRTQSSPAIPFYLSLGSANDITPKVLKRKVDEDEPEEVSTVLNKKVKISPEGEITFYSMEGELLTQDTNEEEEGQNVKISLRGKRKNRKGKFSGKSKEISSKAKHTEEKGSEGTQVVKSVPKTSKKSKVGGEIKADAKKAIKVTPKSAKQKGKSLSKSGPAKAKPKVKSLKKVK